MPSTPGGSTTSRCRELGVSSATLPFTSLTSIEVAFGASSLKCTSGHTSKGQVGHIDRSRVVLKATATYTWTTSRITR